MRANTNHPPNVDNSKLGIDTEILNNHAIGQTNKQIIKQKKINLKVFNEFIEDLQNQSHPESGYHSIYQALINFGQADLQYQHYLTRRALYKINNKLDEILTGPIDDNIKKFLYGIDIIINPHAVNFSEVEIRTALLLGYLENTVKTIEKNDVYSCQKLENFINKINQHLIAIAEKHNLDPQRKFDFSYRFESDDKRINSYIEYARQHEALCIEVDNHKKSQQQLDEFYLYDYELGLRKLRKLCDVEKIRLDETTFKYTTIEFAEDYAGIVEKNAKLYKDNHTYQYSAELLHLSLAILNPDTLDSARATAINNLKDLTQLLPGYKSKLSTILEATIALFGVALLVATPFIFPLSLTVAGGVVAFLAVNTLFFSGILGGAGLAAAGSHLFFKSDQGLAKSTNQLIDNAKQAQSFMKNNKI